MTVAGTLNGLSTTMSDAFSTVSIQLFGVAWPHVEQQSVESKIIPAQQVANTTVVKPTVETVHTTPIIKKSVKVVKERQPAHGRDYNPNVHRRCSGRREGCGGPGRRPNPNYLRSFNGPQ